MGKIYNRFSNQEYINEADVEINFVEPLLKEFLGYSTYNILPKKRYKVRDGFNIKEIVINRNTKIPINRLGGEPDFIITDRKNYKKLFFKDTIEKKEEEKAFFLIEVKGPNENLENFIDQKNAYCNLAKTNLIVMTDGSKFLVYDFNELLLKCNNIEELDTKFNFLRILIHKDNQNISLANRIALLMRANEKFIDIPLGISDFFEYIEMYSKEKKFIYVLNEKFEKINDYRLFNFISSQNKRIDYQDIISQIRHKSILSSMKLQIYNQNHKSLEKNKIIIIKGESGVGKTEFLNHLRYYFFNLIKDKKSNVIPLILKLKYWSEINDIFQIICRELDITILDKGDIKKYLKEGQFLILLDAYDEISLENQKKFQRNFEYFRIKYPQSLILITTKTDDLFFNWDENIFTLVLMKPPKIEDLDYYIRKNLNYNHIKFISEIKNKNLDEIFENPLFLNYLIIYVNNYGNFPESKIEIIEKLISFYFEKYIIEIKSLRLFDINIIKKILSYIAFKMRFELKTEKLPKKEYWKILTSILQELKNSFDITDESITSNLIDDFLLKYNFLVFENQIYSFWHPILLDFFCTIEFIEQIQNKRLNDSYQELFEDFGLKEVVILSFPLIKNPEYITQLKKNNIFLYCESLMEQKVLLESEKEFISNILNDRLSSEYRYIRDITRKLFERFFKFMEKPEYFLIELIKSKNEPDLVKWALLELGKYNNDEVYEFLLTFKESDLDVNEDLLGKPLYGYYLLTLSNFDDKEIQFKIIKEIEKEWRDVSYLEMIGMALYNITRRGKFNSESFKEIMRIFKKPKNIHPAMGIETLISYIRSKALEMTIIEYNDREIIPQLCKILDEEPNLMLDIEIVKILAKIVNEIDIQIIISCIKDENYSIEYRYSLAQILSQTDLEIDFYSLFEVLEYIKAQNFFIELDELDKYKGNFENFNHDHPENKYRLIFCEVLDCFLKIGKIINYNVPQLIEFLKEYLIYPDKSIQERIIKLIGKYNPKLLINNISLFFGRTSVLEYIRNIIILDKKKALLTCKTTMEDYLEEKSEFVNYFVFIGIIEILLDFEYERIAREYFDKFLQSDINYNEYNLFTLSFISKFSDDYKLIILEHFYNKYIELEIDEFNRMDSLLSEFSPIRNVRYINLCLNLLEKIQDELFRYGILHNLILLESESVEEKILDIFKKDISEGKKIYGSLNILAFIGTQLSVDFLEQFLDNPDDILKQKAFYCIRRIKERQNINWYNGEEQFM
ncbi:MAG: hypothetical protein EU529_14820 [Promethearchaeota archaeon]|nr:MAG: hypothetical protein EU529_14820 [Candidatus Lokiarchaeota archaeon]